MYICADMHPCIYVHSRPIFAVILKLGDQIDDEDAVRPTTCQWSVQGR